ncbi:poly-beta-1,6-N-acetyl-D-glucosamine biosynthesis protein PgaD [Cupriavidus taiwanensis]|uniref:Hemin storage system protein (Modular protein) n=1 Tax=Cupriavidus taiwanensis TaxID=164546 RepID=A0A975XDR2_9BURK|nr:poly-beta-1,6-N-acetyl-D-glucosamine biosynthesis protein PgaD [Cupriavidus taiwanensis]MDK3024233.1 poly-beta-1,6-N-acetyl-D-glucosamine biosynthesis protein PgaD [Cupriavidus taiwanensis]SOY66797.1 Hemin storage system protein (modular protein) [Cupriavidus taiwanensis]
MKPESMIIRTRGSRLRWLLDALLTALAWAGFFYLGASGIRAILHEASAGPGVPFWAALLPTMGTLTVYVLVGLFNGIVLLSWALYNQYRFAGLDRRKPLPALRIDELARSFGLPGQRVRALQLAKVAVVEHTQEGEVAEVRAVGSGTPITPDAPASTDNCLLQPMNVASTLTRSCQSAF